MDKYAAERIETLKAAAEGRRVSVMNYQINIDNFRLAIIKIAKEHADNPDMVEFSEYLSGLKAANEKEQLKERIILEVIEQQLEGL